MTTPRDDIAGLSERLRSRLVDPLSESVMVGNGLYKDVSEAATQLAALSADNQVKEQAIADLGRAIHQYRSERGKLSARVKELEARLDEMAKPEEQREWLTAATIDKLQARALRAEQERDEARAALKAEQSRGSYHCD